MMVVHRVLLLSFAVGCGRPADTVTIAARLLNARLSVSSVESYELWVLNQVGRNLQPVTCSALLDRSLVPTDPNLIALKTSTANFAAGSPPIHLSSIADGVEDRIFYVDLYDQANQLGSRVGAGCTQSVTIAGGKTTAVVIAVDVPEAVAP